MDMEFTPEYSPAGYRGLGVMNRFGDVQPGKDTGVGIAIHRRAGDIWCC